MAYHPDPEARARAPAQYAAFEQMPGRVAALQSEMESERRRFVAEIQTLRRAYDHALTASCRWAAQVDSLRAEVAALRAAMAPPASEPPPIFSALGRGPQRIGRPLP